eukprot:TRINITY_DN12814_c0_g1_i2.p1 TRINITY_DN12814_c0_g1~~TRINITY_DN12814_c0_g1_i2.p1  ORF type:complete len:332 (-),score=37.83 TRINITY_DN12814_c0_g1_i2:139-1134(-)
MEQENSNLKPKEIILNLRNGLRVAAKTWGPPQSSTQILALHGWLDNAGTYDSLAPLLAAENIYMVCIDFLGHGKSPHLPIHSEYFAVTHVLTVIQIIESLGWKSFHLMGHSMGASVACVVAGTIPSQVKNLILFDYIGAYTLEQRNIQAPQVLEHAVESYKHTITRRPKIYSSIDECIKKLLTNNPKISFHTAKAIVERGTMQTEGGFCFCHDPRLVGESLMLFSERDVLQFLQRICCPVLLVWAKDTIFYYHNKQKQEVKDDSKTVEPKTTDVTPPKDPEHIINRIQKRMDAISNLQVVVLDGGHHVHSDKPVESFKQVSKFLVKPKPKL